MGLWRIAQDLSRSIRALTTFLESLLFEAGCRCGHWAACSGIEPRQEGEQNSYVLRITNASYAPRDLLLTIHLRVAHAPERSRGHHAHFTASVAAQPRASTTISLQYDWTGEAHFHVDDASFPHKECHGGAIAMPQLYAVTAAISDAEGRRLDELTVYQALTE